MIVNFRLKQARIFAWKTVSINDTIRMLTQNMTKSSNANALKPICRLSWMNNSGFVATEQRSMATASKHPGASSRKKPLTHWALFKARRGVWGTIARYPMAWVWLIWHWLGPVLSFNTLKRFRISKSKSRAVGGWQIKKKKKWWQDGIMIMIMIMKH